MSAFCAVTFSLLTQRAIDFTPAPKVARLLYVATTRAEEV